ncbi:MAG: stage III sporulation protein AB, partial [Ruminococcus sp.]|nr:stage III sporulation protein AB [Ruminococcus sp.]
MLELLLYLVLVLSTTMVGFSFSQKLFRRKEILQFFVLELRECMTKIRYSSMELSEVFSDRFSNYSFNSSVSFSIQWKEMLRAYSSFLSKDDMRILQGFGDTVGKSDASGELANIKMYIELLEEKITDAKNNIDKKSKLYKMFGLTSGLLITILLI